MIYSRFWILILGVCYFSPLNAQNHYRPLYNGRDLANWFTLPGGDWEIINSEIVGTSPASEARHGILLTKEKFKDFELAVVYKAVEGNSGVYFRVDTVDHVVGVKGFQAEVDPSKDGGGLYETLGRGWVVQPTPSEFEAWYLPNQWNEMKIRAVGGDITVWLNGHQSAQLKDDPSSKEGFIGLQLHGGMDMKVIYKMIEIREL